MEIFAAGLTATSTLGCAFWLAFISVDLKRIADALEARKEAP